MFRQILKNKQNGQTMIEYTIVIGVVTMVLFAMNPIIKRSAQGMIKTMADQIGTQENAEQDFAIDSSHLEDATTTTRVVIDKQRVESPGGVINYVYGDRTDVDSVSHTDLGFSQ